MRSFLKCFAIATATLLFSLPALSAGPEKESGTTLGNLLPELKQSYAAAQESDSLLVNNAQWREQLTDMVKSAEELTILLYTQRPEFAFDMAFALENASRLHDAFQEQVLLANRYLTVSRSGLHRYTLLEEALREMYMVQPADSLSPADTLQAELPVEETVEEDAALLDSCLYYTGALNALYGESVQLAVEDSVYFAETEKRLLQAYEYAQTSYSENQKHRFIGGNVNIVQIIKNWHTIIRNVGNDLRTRYSSEPIQNEVGETRVANSWSGSYVLSYAAIALLILVLSFLVAALVGRALFKYVRWEKVRDYKPILSAILAVLLFAVCMFFVRMDRSNPYWRMAYQLLSLFSWLTLAIFVSLLIRVKGEQAKASRNIYVPTLLLAFVCILLRAIFLPASVVPLLFPPALLVFIIWQSYVNVRYRNEVRRVDLLYMWLSVGVMFAVGVLSLCGYSMIGVLVLTFWTFQLALLHTITTLFHLMKRYYENRVTHRKARYHAENPKLPLEAKNAFIEVTWLYDLFRMVILPLTILLSVPASIHLTSRAYQLSLAGGDILKQPLLQREGLTFLTLSNILLVLALYFVFRYLIYLVKGFSRVFRLRRIIDSRPESADPLKESDVNLSLSNTLISLLGWLLYLIIVFSILHIPTSALTLITTGLAAGVGFALKDLINNFFYGIQLMAGRIRVGDIISCDGVRGVVKQVGYQTTQVEDEDGSLIAFTNTDLFTKKFRNLNTGRNYELLRLPVCVRYGTDIDFARKVILEALRPLMVKDKYGRQVVDPSFPVDVRFDSYGDSSVNLIVALYSTVETHYTFPARAKEAIYNAFYENGIEIPFNQHDVYVKMMTEPTSES